MEENAGLSPDERLEALRRAVDCGGGPLVLAVHDYPDPDALAAAFGLQYLFRHWGIESDIYHGGGLGRPENRVMAELVGMTLKVFRDCPDWSDRRGVVIVDTQPGSRNHSVPAALKVLAVVDHHQLPTSAMLAARWGGGNDHNIPNGPGGGGPAPLFDTVALPPPDEVDYYVDIRDDEGCTSTIVRGYLRAAGLTPPGHLATALFLGVQTDTDDLLRDSSDADRAAYVELLALADCDVIRRVRRPLLSRGFYALIARALHNARRRGMALVTDCGDLPAPDQLSAVSDLLIQSADAELALALGRHGGKVYLSLRLRSPQALGARLLRKVVEPEGGSAGGHRQAAGGEVSPPDGNLDRAVRRIIHHFLELADLGREEDRPFLDPERDESP